MLQCDIGNPCTIPQAKGYDHHDGMLDVERFIYLINDDGHLLDANPILVDYANINWNDRSEYLVKFSAADTSGNRAERLFIGMIIDDKQAPVIEISPEYTLTIEACDVDDPHTLTGQPWLWDVPVAHGISAIDNVDGDVSNTLSANPSIINSLGESGVGLTTIEFYASDHAGMFGVDGRDNIANLTRVVDVVDTIAPVIYCKSTRSVVLLDSALRKTE
jgi:hypothetical protein